MTVPDLRLPTTSASKRAGRNFMPRVVAALAGAATVAWLAVYPNPTVDDGINHHHVAKELAHIMAGGASSEDAGRRPVTTVKLVSCVRLPNVPGKSITLALVEFPPDGYTPRHRHPGSVTAFVIKGTLHSQLEGEPVGTYTTAQSWFEPPGAVHLFAENVSKTEPAEILATFIADDNCGPLTIFD